MAGFRLRYHLFDAFKILGVFNGLVSPLDYKVGKQIVLIVTEN